MSSSSCIREGVKKWIFYGQADRKGLPQHPPYDQLFVNFFDVFFILDYDFMCSETDFTQEKGHFHPTSRIPNLSMYTVYCLLLLLCHKMVR